MKEREREREKVKWRLDFPRTQIALGRRAPAAVNRVTYALQYLGGNATVLSLSPLYIYLHRRMSPRRDVEIGFTSGLSAKSEATSCVPDVCRLLGRRIYKIYTDLPSPIPVRGIIGYPVILLFEITGTVVKTACNSRAILRAIDHERCRAK